MARWQIIGNTSIRFELLESVSGLVSVPSIGKAIAPYETTGAVPVCHEKTLDPCDVVRSLAAEHLEIHRVRREDITERG